MGLTFNGTDAWLSLTNLSTNAPNLRITPNLSIAFWFRTNATNPMHMLYVADGSTGYNFGLSLSTASAILLYLNGGVTVETLAETPDNVYRSYIVSFDGANVSWYVNNGSAITGPVPITLAPLTAGVGMGIGANSGGAGFMTGTLSHLTIWDVVLTSGQRTDYHNCVNPTTIGSPVACWKMPGSEAASATITDSSANGYHVTRNGTLAAADDPLGYTAGPAGPPSVYVLFEA